jgi:tRNA-splicing ligase RtcB
VDTINCHHNFTAREVHHGVELWITRKGAIRARPGDRGIIPGSMGSRTYVIRGEGNPDSWMSCAHGAGRRMSRSEARRTFTSADLRKAMGHTAWQADKAGDLVDEIPASYKDIDQVMEDQRDLVTIEHTLHKVLNYKGT